MLERGHVVGKNGLQRGQPSARTLKFNEPSSTVRETGDSIRDASVCGACKLPRSAPGFLDRPDEITLDFGFFHIAPLFLTVVQGKVRSLNSQLGCNMQHSNIVGGSTAKRVMKCPGSVTLVQKMPPQPSSKYASEGTLLHNVIAEMLNGKPLESFIGMTHEGVTLTQELADEKLLPAMAALEEIDPDKQMEYAVESRVGFSGTLEGVFGSTDLLGRLGDRAIVLDWKFGDGVAVEAEENPQLMFYAAAAMKTETTAWVFEGAKEIECIIVQPPAIKRWVTSFDRLRFFERELELAVKLSANPTPPFAQGDHCRWCSAKPICPLMTGAVERALQQQVTALPAQQISDYLAVADTLESWISDLRALAMQMMENGAKLPGYKLVAKRGTRKWIDEARAKAALMAHLPESEVVDVSLISPAQAEKKLKKLKLSLPADQVVSISSGSTFAPVSDPRPEVIDLARSLSKLM